MALRQTRLYYNTGFNEGNTPATTSVLNNARYLDLEAHWDYQDFFLQSIKIKATYDQVKNADYLKYGEAYYWITGISMLNTNTAQLFLSLDALASMGGAKSLTYTSGMLTRAHPLTDNDFDNTLTEPVSTQRSLQIKGGVVEAGPTDLKGKQVFLSTLSLDQEITKDTYGNITPKHGKAVSYPVGGDTEEDREVITPASPRAIDKKTEIMGTKIDGVGYFVDRNVSGTYYSISDNIAYLRSLGLEQAVIGCYVLPDFYGNATYMTNAGKQVNKLTSKSSTITAANWNTGTSRWKKSRYMINEYVVVSKLSGEVKSYKAKDICKTGSGTYSVAPVFKLGADVNINGKPYIWPINFDGINNSQRFNANGICGISWLNLPVVVGGASGELWMKNDYIKSMADMRLDVLQTGYGAIKGAATNMGVPYAGDTIDAKFNQQDLSQALTGSSGISVGGLVDTVVDTSFKAARLTYASRKLDDSFAKSTEFAVPGISGSPAQGLQLAIPNGFYIYHYMPDDRDIAKFDEFFTKYGYSQDCAFSKDYLTDHWNLGYVYIQTSGIHIGRTGKAADVGIGVKDLAEAQLNGGIRIWDRLPS